MVNKKQLDPNSKSQKIRDYIAANPNATPPETAKATGTTLALVHHVRRALGYKAKPRLKPKTKPKIMIARRKKELTPLPTVKEVIATLPASVEKQLKTIDNVNHPPHYKVGGIETIDFIEAKQLNYNLGNVIKYITRADHKGNTYEDLCKARWYLNREISKHLGVKNQ